MTYADFRRTVASVASVVEGHGGCWDLTFLWYGSVDNQEAVRGVHYDNDLYPEHSFSEELR